MDSSSSTVMGSSKKCGGRLPTATECPPQTAAPPDSEQISHGDWADNNNQCADQRGHFKPWALLRSAEWGRAFRFVYPTLLVGSLSKAYLFDVVSARLVQTIENTQLIDGNSLGEIHYVEVNDRHVFICGSIELHIFERANGRLIFRLSPNELPAVTRLGVDVSKSGPTEVRAATLALPLVPDEDRSPSNGNNYWVAGEGFLASQTSSFLR